MRLATLAIAGLVLSSTAALGSTATASKAEKPEACSASLMKANGAAGYKLVRQCAQPASVAVARQPVVNGLGQSEEGGADTVILSLLAAAAVGGGLFVALDGDDDFVPVSP